MSSAFFVEGELIQPTPDGYAEEGKYKKIHRDLGAAIGDFTRIYQYCEDATLRWSA